MKGMIRVHGEWDKVSFDMDNYHIHYLGHTIEKFDEDDIMNLINDHTRNGKMVLSDGLKPLQCMNTYKFK
jgi:hypothetical protein